MEHLRATSARLGRQPLLIQAAGGNTSWKEEGTLWVKASGKWLVHAQEEEIFVPVPLADVLASIDQGIEYQLSVGVHLLRPSVETTMHALLPHPVVVHVHSVNTLAWAVRVDAEALLAERLDGLRWAWIPWAYPGLPLALRMRGILQNEPNVIVLGNHGLVLGAGDCEAAEALLEEVEERLAVPPPLQNEPNWVRLEELTSTGHWRLPGNPVAHVLGTDVVVRRFAAAGTYYPDHCVFLGDGLAVQEFAQNEPNPSVAVAVAGAGVLLRADAGQAEEELLVCLAELARRIPADAPVMCLPPETVQSLMNWDAEKYRQSLAR